MLCYLPNIYNSITFTASLERVQFEFMQSFPVVYWKLRLPYGAIFEVRFMIKNYGVIN